MSVVVQYAVDATLGARLRKVFENEGRNDDLNLNIAASQGERLVLQSVTGSTTVQVLPNTARLQTTYFGDFEIPSNDSKRADYAARKVGRLLALLDAGGVRLTFFGAVAEAHVEAPTGEENRLRSATLDALKISPLLGDDVYDFSLRASCASSDDVFSNTSVNWFTTRTFALEGDAGAVPGLVFSEWDMSPIAEGVELKYDRNNKRGLFAGKREWSSKEFLDIALGTLNDSRSTFEKLSSQIVQSYSSNKGLLA